MSSSNLKGKSFVTGSWSNPSTAASHGTHVAVSAILYQTERRNYQFFGDVSIFGVGTIYTPSANAPLPLGWLVVPVMLVFIFFGGFDRSHICTISFSLFQYELAYWTFFIIWLTGLDQGTMVATGGNKRGVVGVIPNPKQAGVCLIVARVCESFCKCWVVAHRYIAGTIVSLISWKPDRRVRLSFCLCFSIRLFIQYCR